MKQLCYVSYISDGHNADEVIEQIQEISNKNNNKYNLTGALSYTQQIFLQVIEGEKVNVDILYRIISDDKRHSNPVILFEQDIEERYFPDWGMKFTKMHNFNMSRVNDMLEIKKKIEKKTILSKDDVLELFYMFEKN